ncbi:glycine zipper 2TM domain-containing protein [Lyticum sinuosum]|nr:glycine zipper 2TM domain-containing protein [Lyticum sinuosum]
MMLLTGCNGNTSKKDIGTATGAIAGGLIGSAFGGGSGKILTTVIGAGAGGYIGNKVGENMDKTDHLEKEMNQNRRIVNNTQNNNINRNINIKK